ncbi:MAG: TerC family protein [Candidatus Methylacidiphilales bacterium]|nr:TerC family protein [Candidatus Methylacidiphilales bacterium]
MPATPAIETNIWFWIIFNAVVLALLGFDLLSHRKGHVVKGGEAVAWTAFWVSISVLFGAGIWWHYGHDTGILFFTCYLIEYSLSIDNIFIFVLIFSSFQVPRDQQHRVLFWGIIGALILRGIMIAIGAYAIKQFSWILYIFGGLLLYLGFKMIFKKEENDDMQDKWIVRVSRRFLPFTDQYHGEKFSIIENGKRVFTPLLLVLIVVEFTDLIFAVDSIPAIFGVSQDTFIIYTSNVGAILGLRSLYFLLAGAMVSFHFLKIGLGIILMFVGVKMLFANWFHVPPIYSLSFIITILLGSIATSLFYKPKEEETITMEPKH